MSPGFREDVTAEDPRRTNAVLSLLVACFPSCDALLTVSLAPTMMIMIIKTFNTRSETPMVAGATLLVKSASISRSP